MAIRGRDVQPRRFVGTRRAEPVHNAAAAPVAQLDRASGVAPEGREFEALRARHLPRAIQASSMWHPSANSTSIAVAGKLKNLIVAKGPFGIAECRDRAPDLIGPP